MINEHGIDIVHLNPWETAAYDTFITCLANHKIGLLSHNPGDGILDVDLLSFDTLFEDLSDSILEISNILWAELSKLTIDGTVDPLYSDKDKEELIKHYTSIIVEIIFTHYNCNYFDRGNFDAFFIQSPLIQSFVPNFNPKIFYYGNDELQKIPAIVVQENILHSNGRYILVFGFVEKNDLNITAQKFLKLAHLIPQEPKEEPFNLIM